MPVCVCARARVCVCVCVCACADTVLADVLQILWGHDSFHFNVKQARALIADRLSLSSCRCECEWGPSFVSPCHRKSIIILSCSLPKEVRGKDLYHISDWSESANSIEVNTIDHAIALFICPYFFMDYKQNKTKQNCVGIVSIVMKQHLKRNCNQTSVYDLVSMIMALQSQNWVFSHIYDLWPLGQLHWLLFRNTIW